MYSYKQLGGPAVAAPLTNRHRRLLLPAVIFAAILSLCFIVPWIQNQSRIRRLPIPVNITGIHKPAAEDEWQVPWNWDPVIPVYTAFPKLVLLSASKVCLAANISPLSEFTIRPPHGRRTKPLSKSTTHILNMSLQATKNNSKATSFHV